MTWALVSLTVIIPSGMVTLLLEWTGIPINIGGLEIFVSVYLPTLFAVLLVMWLGYLWAAIPAYFASFIVALSGGVPLVWAILFSFANPLGLVAFALAYRAIPFRTDLRSGAGLLFFLLVAFVGALLGSSGSFVWSYTNQIGLTDVLLVWQGWWLGGFLQTALLCVPILFLLSPWVERLKLRLDLGQRTAAMLSVRRLSVAFVMVMASIATYVILVRYLTLSRLESILSGLGLQFEGIEPEILESFQGLTLIHWITLALVFSTGFFGLQIVINWTASLRESSGVMSRLNQQLREEIDAREMAEEALTRKAAALDEANKTKDRFFSLIAHDLRSPLAAIQTLSGVLSENIGQYDRQTLERFVLGMDTSTGHLRDLLEKLLSWSRMQTYGLAYAPETVHLREMAEEVFLLVEPRAREGQVEVTLDIPATMRVEADPNMLRSILLNLMTNAVKFSNAGAQVVVAARPSDARILVEVSDTGIGMDQAQLEGLFRLDSDAYTEFGRGTGLGLILSREMAAYHGSELSVQSAPGVGSTFRFTLDGQPDQPAASS